MVHVRIHQRHQSPGWTQITLHFVREMTS